MDANFGNVEKVARGVARGCHWMRFILFCFFMKHGETLEQFLHRAADVLFPGGEPERLSVNSRASDGDTPLHIAALWGDRHAARLLLDAGADVNAKGDMSCSPLYYAVMCRHLKVAELLLSRGANADADNELGFTSRRLAKHNDDTAMIALLRGSHTVGNER